MDALGEILVLDDNADWRDQLRAILEKDGFSVRTASNPEEASELLLERPVHAVVVDLKLGDLDLSEDAGFALFEEIDRLDLSEMIYGVVVSGHASPKSTREAFKRYGVVDCFEKGELHTQIGQFLQAIREAVIKAKYAQLSKLGFRCFKTGSTCTCSIRFNSRQVFVAMPYNSELIVMDDVYDLGIRAALQELNYEPLRADKKPVLGRDLMCNVCKFIQESAFGIVDITDWNPNVLLELGMMFGWGRTAVIIKHENSQVPSDLRGALYIEYASINSLKEQLKDGIPNLEL